MSEDIINNIEIFPIVVGVVISVIFVILALFSNTMVSIIGLILASAIAGFLCRNTTVYAIIYGAVIGLIASLFIGLITGILNMFILYIVLGIFGAFVGKFIQSKQI